MAKISPKLLHKLGERLLNYTYKNQEAYYEG